MTRRLKDLLDLVLLGTGDSPGPLSPASLPGRGQVLNTATAEAFAKVWEEESALAVQFITPLLLSLEVLH